MYRLDDDLRVVYRKNYHHGRVEVEVSMMDEYTEHCFYIDDRHELLERIRGGVDNDDLASNVVFNPPNDDDRARRYRRRNREEGDPSSVS